tara:strand:+ start:144 stop:680 length:537 start_codon:yes stop_codon:yes gene_type:complete
MNNNQNIYKTFELLNSIYHILNGNLELKSRTYGKDFFSDLELNNSKISRVSLLLNSTRYMISWGYLTNLHQNWCKFKHLCNKYPLILNYASVHTMLHKIIEQSQIIICKNNLRNVLFELTNTRPILDYTCSEYIDYNYEYSYADVLQYDSDFESYYSDEDYEEIVTKNTLESTNCIIH